MRATHLLPERVLSEVDEYFAIGARVRPGDTVFDVGANVGAFALRAAERARGDVALHCFEPSHRTFEVLEATFREEPDLASTRHRLHRVALGRAEDAGARRVFYHFENFPTDSTLHIEDKRAEFELFFLRQGAKAEARLRSWVPGRAGRIAGRGVDRVVSSLPRGTVGRWVSDRVTGLERSTCSIDALVRVIEREHVARIDLLKIDVEGAEVEVLEGAYGVWERIGSVVVETSERDGRSRRSRQLLEAAGMRIVRAAPPRATHRAGLDNVILYAERPTRTAA